MSEALKKELQTLERNLERLKNEHMGKYVLIHGDEVIDTYDAFETAAQEGISRFGEEPFLIRRIGDNEIELPVSVLYGQTRAHHSHSTSS